MNHLLPTLTQCKAATERIYLYAAAARSVRLPVMKTKRAPSTLQAPDGQTLHLHHWRATSPCGVVVMLHGLSEHALMHAPTAQYLQASGWNVLAADLRGHGLSQGARGAIQHNDDFLHDLAAVLDLSRQLYPNMPLVLLGHSMGGSIAARFAAARAHPMELTAWSRPLDGLILSSPSLLPTIGMVQKALLSAMGRLIQDIALPVVFKPEWVSTDPIAVEDYNKDPLVHRRITPRVAAVLDQYGQFVLARAARWTVPTLMLYTQQDRLVEPRACEQFAAALPPGLSTIQAFQGMAHNILREQGSESVYHAMQQWLSKVFPKS